MKRWLLLWLCCCCWAPAQTELYQFGVNLDALAGAPDFSFLNQPLQPADRIFVCGGHFCRVGADLTPGTADDSRVRFWGVNLAFSANFPATTDAVRIAKRMRRLGINLVRLHHLDTSPDSNAANAASLLTTGAYPSLNPQSVARLRTFLDALKNEGIYVNLNLIVGYQFRPGVDQLPALTGFPSQSKPLRVFYPRMVELQEQFTRRVIEALGLAEDPVLAMVEISNEDSLVHAWQAGSLDQYLQGAYAEELRTQWNRFLLARHGGSTQLRAAWGETEPDGPNLLPGAWVIERSGASNATWENVAGADPPVVRVVVTSTGPNLVFKQVGFSVTQGESYEAKVDLRLDAPAGSSRSIYWDVKLDVSPWTTMAAKTITVTSEWQTFTLGVPASFPMNNTGRFGLYIPNLNLPLLVRNATFYKKGKRGLNSNESLEASTVELVSEGDTLNSPRTNDYLEFLVSTDRVYLNRIRDAARALLPKLVPITGTQMGFGGLLNLDSHDGMDYIDEHFYQDHPGFPGQAWDDRNWYIRNNSSVGTGLGEILSVAANRRAGRPYTVSEFNQAWPNQQAAEIDPLVSVLASFQDWDGLMHFAYSHDRSRWDAGVPSGFDLEADHAKLPGFGQAALLFRRGLISPAKKTLLLPVDKTHRLQAAREKRRGGTAAFLSATGNYNANTALRHSVALDLDGSGPLPEEATVAHPRPVAADTDEFFYHDAGRFFIIRAPQVAGAIGYLGQEERPAGDLSVQLAASARGFAAILATALDETPLRSSSRILLSNPGYALRTHAGSNPPRPQQLIPYPGNSSWYTIEPESGSTRPSGSRSTGVTPTWMERVEAFVTLRTHARSLTVYPLDGAGARLAPLPPDAVRKVDGGFRIHLQATGQPFTPWYEIEAEQTKPSIAALTSAMFTPKRRIAALEILSLFGARLAPSAAAAPSVPLPGELAGARIRIDGSPTAPLYFVSPSQVNFQAGALSPGEHRLVVERLTPSGQVEDRSDEFTFEVVAASPTVFGNPELPVYFQNITQDPGGRVFASPARPARPGDAIITYWTGLGQTNPPLAPGERSLLTVLFQPLVPIQVTVGGTSCLLGAAASPEFPGLYQIAFQVPARVAGPWALVSFQIGETTLTYRLPVAAP